MANNSVNNEDQNENRKAIQEFLLDIECLDSLSPWISRFNVFEILGITQTEIRHSNTLAWLMDPNENHSLDDDILRGIVQYAIKKEKFDEDPIKILLMDFHSFSIKREWNHIDLMAVSKEEKFAVCIENKVFSGEHDDQLNRYREAAEKHFKGYRVLYLYLTPSGIEASDEENWIEIGYDDILKIIESSLERHDLSPDVDMFINNYLETIRNTMLEDNELIDACNEIYTKHRKALDLIYETRPDTVGQLHNIIADWCKKQERAGKIKFDEKHSSKTLLRFTTETMTSILPDADDALSVWKTKNFYFYEFQIDKTIIWIRLNLNFNNIPDEQREICNQLLVVRGNKTAFVSQTSIWSGEKYELGDSVPSEAEEEILEHLDKVLKEMFVFESKIVADMESESL